MNAMECRDRTIDARELHHDKTVEEHALAEAAKPAVRHACDPKRAVLADEFEWEFSATPILVDNGRNLLFCKCPHPTKQGLILRADKVRDLVEISVDNIVRRVSRWAAARRFRDFSKKVSWRRLRFHGMFPFGTKLGDFHSDRGGCDIRTLDVRKS